MRFFGNLQMLAVAEVSMTPEGVDFVYLELFIPSQL